jgi:hypothetical protein
MKTKPKSYIGAQNVKNKESKFYNYDLLLCFLLKINRLFLFKDAKIGMVGT